MGGALPTFNRPLWTELTQGYEDQVFVEQVGRGLEEGFAMGYTGVRESAPFKEQQFQPHDKQVILAEFDREVQRGFMIKCKSLPSDLFYFRRISPTFALRKKDGKTRRIDHLSHPRGESVNDGINKEDFPVNYVKYDEISELLATMKAWGLFSARDVEEAYRWFLINPADWPLLVSYIDGHFYVNLRGVFGSRSMPRIASYLLETMRWIVLTHTPISRIVSILDDYLFTHEAEGMTPEQATRDMGVVDELFESLGLPIKHAKSVTAVRQLQFMGVEWDIDTRTISIPQDKCDRYAAQLAPLVHAKARHWPLKDFESMVGHLAFVSRFIKFSRGRLFWIYADLHGARRGRRRLASISEQSHLDLEWFFFVLQNTPSSIPVFPFPSRPDTRYIVTTDGAPSWGVGGFWGDESFSIRLAEPYLNNTHSTVVELLALVVACMCWAPRWEGQWIFWRTDCSCHISGLRKLRTRSRNLLLFHQLLDFLQAKYNFRIWPRFLRGKDNTVADSYSRGLIEATIGPYHWQQAMLVPIAEIYGLLH